MSDPYEDLGIERDADLKTIKNAYRKLSKQHHPDAGGEEEAFLRICKAYEVLSDPERRKKYDETGDASEPHDAVQDKAMQLLARAFDLAVTGGTGDRIAVDELKHLDLPAEMRRYLADDVRTVSETLEAGEKLRAALVDMYARVEKAPEKDAFGEVLAGRIQQIDTTTERVKFQKSAVERAMAMLEGYAYRVDPRRASSFAVRGKVHMDFVNIQALREMGLYTTADDEDIQSLKEEDE